MTAGRPLTTAVAASLLAGLALAVASCGSGASVAEQSAHRTANPALPARFFAPNAVWNTPISADAALDPTSAARTAAIARQAETIGSGINTDRYSTPVYTVGPNQQTQRVRLDTPNQDLNAAAAAVPLPRSAEPARGSDHHIVIWQPSRDTFWEFWRFRGRPGRLRAGYGGKMIDVQSSPGYFRGLSAPDGQVLQQPWWGATATSLPLLGGLITTQELRRGTIDHALALGVPRVEAGVRAFPAQRSDGRYTGVDSIPEGARLRLDPSLNISQLGLPPAMRAIAEAAQRYGLIVRDGSATLSLYAQDPSQLVKNPYPKLFSGLRPYRFAALFPWDRLQLLKMDLTRDTGSNPGREAARGPRGNGIAGSND